MHPAVPALRRRRRLPRELQHAPRTRRRPGCPAPRAGLLPRLHRPHRPHPARPHAGLAMTTTAATFAAVAVTLHAAHQLGDHLVQTDNNANGKAAPGRTGWAHVLTHV